MKFFPYQVRKIQEDLITSLDRFLKSDKKTILIEAPTGLGKTIASLSSALQYAEDKDYVIFFVTSKNTQHIVANDTVKDILDHIDKKFTAVDVIGKSNMCIYSKNKNTIERTASLFSFGKDVKQKEQPKERPKVKNIEKMCAKLKEEGKCYFFSKTYKSNKLSPEAEFVLREYQNTIVMPKMLRKIGKDKHLCPYELALNFTKKSKIIIGDYNYLFSDGVREIMLKRSGISLDKIILVVDEAHNLPDRVINEMSANLNLNTLQYLISHLEKNHMFDSVVEKLYAFIDKIKDLNIDNTEKEIKQNSVVFKDELINNLETLLEYFIDINFDEFYDIVVNLLSFISLWKQATHETHIFFIKKNENFQAQKINLSLCVKCLDPSVMTNDLFKKMHKTILMSATLQPMDMYIDVLGLENYETKIFPSPFPKENKHSFILTNASTKYTERNNESYFNIAKNITEVLKNNKKNSIIFFPSYEYKENIKTLIKRELDDYRIFEEVRGMTPKERENMLDEFQKAQPSILLAVTLGSFSESINLHGEKLSIVYIVGLPLQRPSLEVKALIRYYDDKFGKGMSYGYYLPALAKTLQAAGRCIRSSEDKGIIVFYDYRFANQGFMDYLDSYEPELANNYTEIIEASNDLF